MYQITRYMYNDNSEKEPCLKKLLQQITLNNDRAHVDWVGHHQELVIHVEQQNVVECHDKVNQKFMPVGRKG